MLCVLVVRCVGMSKGVLGMNFDCFFQFQNFHSTLEDHCTAHEAEICISHSLGLYCYSAVRYMRHCYSYKWYEANRLVVEEPSQYWFKYGPTLYNLALGWINISYFHRCNYVRNGNVLIEIKLCISSIHQYLCCAVNFLKPLEIPMKHLRGTARKTNFVTV